MTLDDLVLAGVAGIANLCEDVLHGEDSAAHTKTDRQNAVQYVHALKDMLKAEKSGRPVEMTGNFRELAGYFSNYFIDYEVNRRASFNKLCNSISLACLVGGVSGSFFRNPDGDVSKAGYFAMGVGFGGFLLTEFFRFVVGGMIKNKELEVRNEFEQVLKADDDIWRRAVSKIRYEPRRYLENHKWYG